MRETVTLTTKEQARLLVIGQVDRGQVSAGMAAEVLGLSERHVRRLLAGYRRDGVAALAHGNRGRLPAHTVPVEVRHEVVKLARTRYAGLNDQHLTEKLETDGIVLSRSTVRRIRQAAGVVSPRTRRAPKHRQRRERRAQSGLLVQWDGSHHAWLEERGPRLVLLAAIDAATGEVLAAHFRLTEDTHGYLQLLHDLVTAHGCPVAIYHDRHSIFRVPAPTTVAEQLTSHPSRTQLGRALAELGIESIAARSPQVDLQTICCFTYQRTVGLDNTVQLDQHRLQLLPGRQRISDARATVEVRERLDGSLAVYYQGEQVASQAAPAEAPVLRARTGRVIVPQPGHDVPRETPREELAVAVGGVGLWAGAAAAVHTSTPHRPDPSHPWCRPFKVG